MKNIIFDLGGVILNINYLLTEEEFKKLGITNFDELFSQMKQSDLFDRLETGVIGETEFCDELRAISNTNLSNEQIVYAWNKMLLDLPFERLTLLESLKEKYNLFLFSNTNIIHLKAFNEIIQDQHGIPNIDSYFTTAYYSHEFGHRKPHSESFQKLLDREGLLAEETFFIDDTLHHVEGARQIGIEGIFLEKGQTILDLNF